MNLIIRMKGEEVNYKSFVSFESVAALCYSLLLRRSSPTRDVPILGDDAEVSAHFFFLWFRCDRLVCLTFRVVFLGPGRVADIPWHHELLLVLDACQGLSILFSLLPRILQPVFLIEKVLSLLPYLGLVALEGDWLEEVVHFTVLHQLMELDFNFLE